MLNCDFGAYYVHRPMKNNFHTGPNLKTLNIRISQIMYIIPSNQCIHRAECYLQRGHT